MPRQIMWFRRDDLAYDISLHPSGRWTFTVPESWGEWLRDRSDNKGLFAPRRERWTEGRIQHRFAMELVTRALYAGYMPWGGIPKYESEGPPPIQWRVRSRAASDETMPFTAIRRDDTDE